MTKLIRLWLPVILWMGAIFIGSSVGSVPRVGSDETDEVTHRLAHVIEFGVLGALLLRATSHGKLPTRREVLLTLAIVGLYGASDEFHQRFTPGRSSEGLTVLFDVAGGALGLWAYRWWKMTTTPRPRSNE